MSDKKDIHHNTLVDSGASCLFIDAKVANEHPENLTQLKDLLPLELFDGSVEGGVENNQDCLTTILTTQPLRPKYQTTIEDALDKDSDPSNKPATLSFNGNPNNPILLTADKPLIPTPLLTPQNANQQHQASKSNHVATIEEIPDKDEDPTNKPTTIPYDGNPNELILLPNNKSFGTMEDDI